MTQLCSQIVLLAALAAMPIIAGGCRGAANPAPPAPTTNVSDDPADKPLPRPEEGRAYLETALKDETRLIEVYNDRGMDGALDSSGRRKLRQAVGTWWKGIETVSRIPKAGESPFRVTPDMGIRIYPPGSAAAAQQQEANGAFGHPDLQIMIYKARQISRVLITDPTARQVNQAVYIIPSTQPMDWVNRLFMGKM